MVPEESKINNGVGKVHDSLGKFSADDDDDDVVVVVAVFVWCSVRC